MPAHSDLSQSLPSPARITPARVAVETLMQGGSEAVLVHRGRKYRLRINRSGKLTLTG